MFLGEKIEPLGTTAADGRFSVAVPKEAKYAYLFAGAEGAGLDFLYMPQVNLSKPAEFRLVKDRPIRGRIVNTEGKPVPGVRVTVKSINVYANNSLDSFLIAWKKRHHMSGIPTSVKNFWTEIDLLSPEITDTQGRFIVRGVGDERLIALRLSGAGIANQEAWIANRDGFDPKPYNQATLDNIPKGLKRGVTGWFLHGPDLSIVGEAEKPIRGTVKDISSGKGRPGVVVRLTRFNNSELVSPIVKAKTDAQGRYELRGAHKVKRYMLEVAADTTAGYMPCQVWADDMPGYQPITRDIAVKKGVIITGKIIDGATGDPIPGFAMTDALNDNPFAKDYPPIHDSAWFPMQKTDAKGTFRVVAVPGPVILMGGPRDSTSRVKYKMRIPDPKYPRYFSRLGGGQTVVYHNFRGRRPLIQGTFCKVLQIKPDAKTVEQDIVLEPASTLTVHIQDAEGKPLAGVCFAGNSPRDWYSAVRCDKAECTVYQLEPGKPRLLVFFHPERKLAGTLTLKGDEKAPVTAKLNPAGSIKGRLLDADGKPLAGVIVDLYYRQRLAEEVHNVVHQARQILSDGEGVFTSDDVIPGQKCVLSFHRGKRKFERTRKPSDPALEVKSGECRDLGAIQLKLLPEEAGQ